MSIITRIAPSPTGHMHIGTGRTALYNWLFARRNGGKFLVRIEDTDRARHSEDAVLAIINGLKWLELDWDGEVVSQFERRDRHAAVARELVEKGKAYYCYCTPEELDAMRAQAKAEGRATFYDRRWRDRNPEDAPEGVAPVIRIKAPLSGDSTLHDHVQGEVRVSADNLDDFIILRSDGTPTYMLSVVVDDHDAGVTHVIRGDDHLNNAFRQKIILEAMGWPVPEYAHLPLILGEDGAKLSKRHGAQSVEDYKDMGYLPEAMRNYLLRLGWSHGNDEIITTEQALDWFDLEHIGQSASRFDFAKLDNLNAHYIKACGNERMLTLITPLLYQRHQLDIIDNDIVARRILAAMDELKSRAKNINQIADEAAFFAKTIPYDFDEKAQDVLQGDALSVLDSIKTRFSTIDDFVADNIQAACKDVADMHANGKLGKIGMPLRAALTGTTVSPSIFHAAEILGPDETLARLTYALEHFSGEKHTPHSAAN